MTELFPPESVASLPGALAVARNRLEQIRVEYDTTKRSAEESGFDGELDHCSEWRQLTKALKHWEQEVARMEREALG